jgi:hypothetical protein
MPIQKFCKKCNKEFWVKPSRINKAKFCCFNCKNKYIISDETRYKMSIARKNLPSFFKGKHHSIEAKEKMRLKKLGKKASDKTKEKMRLRFKLHDHPMLGKKHSPEIRIKISKGCKGKNRMELHPSWTGNNAKYFTIHAWILNNYGKANHCINPNCLHKSKNFNYANITGVHYRDIRYYIPLCISCHRKFDDGRLKYVDILEKPQ